MEHHAFALNKRVECIVVSILIVRGPHGDGHSLSIEVLHALQQQVLRTGRMLDLRACAALCDFVALVVAARVERNEFVLLDPGELVSEIRAHPEAGLSEAIDELPAPYIDVHDDFSGPLGRYASLHKAPVATIAIKGNIASGYRIGVNLALRRLESLRHRRIEPTHA
jgi:hypothetical protein